MNKPKVLLDSGAYTAFKKGDKAKPIVLEQYAQYVVEHGHEYAGCFNLDSIGDAKQSYLNWIKLRDMGAQTIPVYHLGTPEKYLKMYLKQTGYIGLGAIANMDTEQRLRGLSGIWKRYLVDHNNMPIYHIHGLGLTAIKIMLRYPWYSVDSFTPVISAVWGSILLPKTQNYDIETTSYLGLGIYKVSSQGNHKVGTENSFLGLPRKHKDFYQYLFEKFGFKLGEIEYQKKTARRGKKKEFAKKIKPMLEIIHNSDPNIATLANSWEERMRFNLVMWTELRKRLPIYPRPFEDKESTFKEYVNNLPKTLMFMGVSTATHLRVFNSVLPKLDILVSYYYLSKKIDEGIKNYVK